MIEYMPTLAYGFLVSPEEFETIPDETQQSLLDEEILMQQNSYMNTPYIYVIDDLIGSEDDIHDVTNYNWYISEDSIADFHALFPNRVQEEPKLLLYCLIR